MNKILIEVKLPVADMTYDILVPDTMQIGTLTELVSKVFTRLSKGVYSSTGSALLCESNTGKEYDMNMKVYETDIHNGTKLLLY